MNYLEDINVWIEHFVKTVCGREDISSDEAERLKDLYVNLRSKYKKETIDQITSDCLKVDENIIQYFKSKEIADSEISDLFNFYEQSAEIVSSKEFQTALSDSFTNNDVSKIKDFKIQKIHETGLLSFVEFKHYFKHDVAFCDVKEALGWCLAYVESGDYNITDIIVQDNTGEINKEKTFENILNDINKKSLTNVPPFKMENGKVSFVAAGSSELDVKLWNESEQKIIGMSATRDRTNLIEGNQFIRHNMYINAWAANYAKYKKQNRLPPEYKLSADDVRKITHDFGWQNKLRDKSILRIRELNNDVVNVIEKHHMEFARHLSYVREFVMEKTGRSYHENGLNISEDEMKDMTHVFKDYSKYYFFGEILNKAQVPELHAGLNKRAYLGNYQSIMNFSMGHEATKIFIDSLEVRFNAVKSDAEIDKYAEYIMYNILSKSTSDFAKLAELFSEGNVFKEERGTLFKSVSVFLEDVNKLELIDPENINKVLNLHFSTLTVNQKQELTDKLISCELFKILEDNYKTIVKAPSEVNQFAENMISYSKACENKIQLIVEKNKNNTMLAFLKSQGIEIDQNMLEQFEKTQKDNKKDNIINNSNIKIN